MHFSSLFMIKCRENVERRKSLWRAMDMWFLGVFLILKHDARIIILQPILLPLNFIVAKNTIHVSFAITKTDVVREKFGQLKNSMQRLFSVETVALNYQLLNT